MAAIHRPLYKVSFHLGGSRGGAELLTGGLKPPSPPPPSGYAPAQMRFIKIKTNRVLHQKVVSRNSFPLWLNFKHKVTNVDNNFIF